jgi:hypothetical protein
LTMATEALADISVDEDALAGLAVAMGREM